MQRILRPVLALVIVALLLPAPPAGGQGAIRFGALSTQSDFPQEIIFSVTVEGEAQVVELELSYRVSGSAYTQSRYPDFTPANRVETVFRLDTQVEFYSPGTEFRYYWTARDALGHVAESAEQTFVYEDDRFAWREVSTARVAAFWYEGEQSFGQEVLDTAMRTLQRLEKDAGVQADKQIRIYLYATERDFRGALGPHAAEWIGGQARPPLAIIVANILPGDEFEIRRMIPHEVSHVVLYQATHNPYADNPNWLEEGIAVHNQEEPDADYPAIVEEAARGGQLIPLRALSASFPSDTDLALLSYAESSSIIEFILRRYGQDGLSSLVHVFAEGETADAAVQRALGVTLAELDARWRATLPAAERTPVAAATPRSRPVQSPGGLDRLVPLVASGVAIAFLLSIGIVVAAVVVIVRRQRRRDREDSDLRHPPGPL